MESVNTIYSRCSYDMSATRYIFDTICPLRGRNLCREGHIAAKAKTQFRAKQGSSRTPKSPPACGRDRVGSQHRCEILPPKPNQERNIIKSKRIRRGGFFPLRSAKRNISHHDVIYRIRRIYRAEGISCALRARSEGAKTSRKREVLLLPNSRRDVVCLKRKEYFDLCGGRLKALP